jgi:predicted nucleotidyltransferase
MTTPNRPDVDLADLAQLFAESTGRDGAAPIAAAYLFGSRAEGREHRESDVDLAVLFDPSVRRTSLQRQEDAERLSGHLQRGLRRPDVDLVILNDAPPGLAAKIVTTGRLVYCATPDVEHAFRRDAQLRAADVAPFLARAARVKLDGLRR